MASRPRSTNSRRPRPPTRKAGADMCRWIAYFGNPIRPRTLLYDTPHGLVEQSRRDRLASGNPNADGFGLGWYDGDGTEPGLYRNTQPAWADRNLIDLAGHIRSPLFLGHV